MKPTNKDKPHQRNLRMKCSVCGHWNRVPVNKIFIEQPSPEPKVKAYIPMYNPLETVKCKKCGKKIAETNELIRIKKSSFARLYRARAFSCTRMQSRLSLI